MYPRLVIDLKKLGQNLDAVAGITKRAGCSLAIVTKSLCADPEVVKVIAENPQVDLIADSRVQNIASFADLAHEHGKKTMLLRIPMHCEIEDVVKYVDLSQNSELSTIRLLNEEAGRQGKTHGILLMIDMGDLREGMFFQYEDKIFEAVEEILKMENIELCGVGVNLTCYGAIIPKASNLGGLVDIARRLEERFGIKMDIISGGNSSSIYLALNRELSESEMIVRQGGLLPGETMDTYRLPEGVNNLRLGESFLLGNDTAYLTKLPGTVDDALILEAQIVELKEKPSIPIGEVGVDAFGEVPEYEDRGVIKRAIIGVGKQDTDIGGMIPLDPKIDVLGGSSDHMILDVTNSDTEYKVGDVVSFKLEYGAALRTATSAYVEKAYVK
ncbi:MAG: alanine/ornithine racemase family PLP-dependent enzyme [Firmicutes bacterium]|nr:alanine/ornithine racemase family PLP-dependent enzyme [Bacillota bacterium]